MLLICDDFPHLTWTYLIRPKSDTTVARFEHFLADEHVAGTPSAVEGGGGGGSKETLQKSVGGTTSARSLLQLIVRHLRKWLNVTSRW